MAALAVLATLAQGLSACGGCEQRGGDPSRLVPGDAPWAVVVPSVARVRENLVRFLAGIEGASGAVDLVRERYGVDLGDLEALGLVGVDPRSGLVFFETTAPEGQAGALAVAVGVSGPERFMGLVSSRAEKGAGARIEPPVGEPAVSVAVAPPVVAEGPPAWRLAYGVAPDAVGLLVFTSGDEADPVAVWRGLAGGGGGFLATPLAKAALEQAGEGAVAWFAARVRPELPDLGSAGAFLKPYADGLAEWTGAAHLSDVRLTVKADGRYSGEGTLPTGWFRAPTGPSTLPALFPKATTVYAHGAPDLGRVRLMPAWLRDRVLPPALPGVDPTLLPPPSQLLDALDGELAVAVLGLDPNATVTRIVAPGLPLTALFQAVHVAVAARLRSPEAGLALLEEIRTSAPLRGWVVAPVAGGGWTGATFTSRAGVYALLVRGDVLVLTTGAGEAERFVAVGEERAVSLATLAGDPTVDAALGLTPATVGAVASFTRVTRELADKGVPPYFLKIINDIRTVAAVLRLRPDGAHVTLDLSL